LYKESVWPIAVRSPYRNPMFLLRPKSFEKRGRIWLERYFPLMSTSSPLWPPRGTGRCLQSVLHRQRRTYIRVPCIRGLCLQQCQHRCLWRSRKNRIYQFLEENSLQRLDPNRGSLHVDHSSRRFFKYHQGAKCILLDKLSVGILRDRESLLKYGSHRRRSFHRPCISDSNLGCERHTFIIY